MTAHRFFTALGVVTAAMLAIHLHPVFIMENVGWISTLMGKVTGLFVVLSFAWLINSFLNMLNHLYGRNPNIPVKGLVQAVKIVVFLITGVFVLSLLLGRKTMYIIPGLSALAAVFSLIFKDPKEEYIYYKNNKNIYSDEEYVNALSNIDKIDLTISRDEKFKENDNKKD